MAGRGHQDTGNLKGTGHRCHVMRKVWLVLAGGSVFLLLATGSSEGYCFHGHCGEGLGKGQDHSWMRCKDSELLVLGSPCYLV